jgi:small-conductance mechanosensitive channel
VHGTRVALVFALIVVGIGSLLSLLIPNSLALGVAARPPAADGFEPVEPLDVDPALLR